jgi:hypothetical protein
VIARREGHHAASRSAALSVNSLLRAPRILKAPARCRFSHLKNTVKPLASSNDCDEITGVRWMRLPSRRAAARTSSMVSVIGGRLCPGGQAVATRVYWPPCVR